MLVTGSVEKGGISFLPENNLEKQIIIHLAKVLGMHVKIKMEPAEVPYPKWEDDWIKPGLSQSHGVSFGAYAQRSTPHCRRTQRPAGAGFYV